MFVDFNILNQLGSPAINSNTFANRPAAGQTGRLFVSTDTFEIYRDNGTTWDLIGGPGSSTITGTGTATQVAYFTSSQAIGSSANLFWDNTNTRLGIGTATPGAALDIHSTGIMAQLNSTSATANSLLAFQRSGSGLWRIGDNYGGGTNYFELYNTVLGINAMQVFAATNKTSWQATETYTTGLARGNYFDYNLNVAAGGSFSSPNAITALGASLDLTLAGNATIPSGARSGLDAYNSISFTGAGTLTHNQGAQIRAYSNVTAGWAFNGTQVGTITHLAGLRALFPDNSGSAVNVTNNYALLLNDQTANTGTVTYTNRWGVYQEGASDLNYMASNLLLGSTVNNGDKLQVTGNASFTGNITAPNFYIPAGSAGTVGLSNVSAAIQFYSGSVSPANSILFYNNGVNTARFDSSGNFGLGVTPSAWSTTAFGTKAFQVGSVSSLADIGITYGTFVGHNWVNLQSTGDRYLVNGFASYYQQVSGQHRWFTAPSGVAGNPISFTQAMTLDASGRLAIGGTVVTDNNLLNVQGSTATNNIGLVLNKTNATAQIWAILNQGPLDIYNYTTSTYAARITTGGNFLIGTATDAGYKLDVNGSANASTLYENGVRVIPSQTGNNGKYLTTNGTITSWATVSAGKQTAIFRVTTNGAGSVTATEIQGISGVTWAATISGSNIVLTPTPNIFTFNSIATGSTAISSGGAILICVPQPLGSSSQTFSFYDTTNSQVNMSTTATASSRPTILQIIIN